jgi:hypothetical protein
LSRGKRLAAAITLMVLAPVIAEVMSGATRVSFIVVLIPEIMVWGGGALMIRELVLRWRAGWTSMLILGLALSVAEEFIIQQTSIAPLPWLTAGQGYGRAAGVNWVYFLYMLGYESVWVVLVPVQLTQLIFRDRRQQRWLRTAGLLATALLFLVGSFIAWFAWTQIARTKTFHAPEYHPPALLIAAGLLAIATLTFAAWKVRLAGTTKTPETRNAPAPWAVGVGTLLLGLPWWVLLALVFIPTVSIPFVIPLAAGLVWAAGSYFLVRRWSSGAGWDDRHRWALVFGAILVCTIGGFAGSSAWPKVDLIGKTVLNAIAVVCLTLQGWKLYRLPTAQT